MESMIRETTGITSTCDTAGTTAKSLTLTSNDGGQTTFQCVFDAASGVTRIASSSGALTSYLTSDHVTLGGVNCADAAMSLKFICTSYPGRPSGVQITFQLQQKGAPATQFQKAQTSFQTTVNVRN
jgi:hypothetical protein